jgi:predicted metal-dependent peptidase
MSDAQSKVASATTALVYARPYYASAAHAVKLIVDSRVPALAVDRWWRLYANPSWVARVSVDELASSVGHELLHLLLDHHDRAVTVGVSEVTRDRWLVASDMDVNDAHCRDCVSHKPFLALPPAEWRVLPGDHDLPERRPAEFYFNALRGRGDSGSASRGSGHTCGSGATGVTEEWDVGSPETSGVDGVDEVDAYAIKQEVATAIVSSREATGPLREWAMDMLKIRPLPWSAHLASTIRRAYGYRAGASVHSYTRPSRRQHAYGRVVAPSYRSPCPRLSIVEDVSASMEDQRARVRAVVEDACRHLGATVQCIECDDRVHSSRITTTGRTSATHGGGGTDMRVGIETALLGARPADIVVVVTDCDTPWPDRPPAKPVIVAACGATQAFIDAVPAWARVIRVEDQ